MILWALFALAAYLCGSIPFGLLLGKLKGVDIREHGSRNIGATNVGRVLGKRLGLFCFALDALKGAAPVAAAGLTTGVWGLSATEIGAGALVGWLSVAIAALAGHMASPWLRFRGGKGVATGFGALLGMWPILTVPALIAFACWLVVVAASRYVSLASVAAAAALPLATVGWAWRDAAPVSESLPAIAPAAIAMALLGAIVIVKHRANLARLRAGTEPRLGASRPALDAQPDTRSET